MLILKPVAMLSPVLLIGSAVTAFRCQGVQRQHSSATTETHVRRAAPKKQPVGFTTTLSPATDDGAEAATGLLDRRSVLASAAGVAALSLWSLEAPVSLAVDVQRPVVILGASGKTGGEVAAVLAKQGRPVVTLTRSGVDPFLTRQKLPYLPYITHYPKPASVTDPAAMKAAMAELKPVAIIYCASASAKGGTAAQVDDEGVGNAARVAKEANARFILVSALAVDRPESKSFQITNTLGGYVDGIMDAKLRGEEKVRATLKNYVIVRPGVLMGGKTTKLGAAGVELNQGDRQGGGLSRDELAEVVVAALDSDVRGATVEAYRAATRTRLQPEFDKTSGDERGAATYAELFTTGAPLRLDR